MFTQIISWLPLVYLGIVAIPLVIIDLREHRLPNKIVLPFIALAFIANIATNIIQQSWGNLGVGLGLTVAIFILGIIANYFDILGMGDVKMFSGIYLALSVFSPLLALWVIPITIGFGLLGFIVGLLMRKLTLTVPLGPWMLVATAFTLTIVWG